MYEAFGGFGLKKMGGLMWICREGKTIMAKGLIDLLLDSIFDANWTGRHGEKLTERELKLVKLFGRKGRILRNVYVPKENGETSEIDVLFITQKGIFVIESKNYSGWIFGDEKAGYWTAMLPNKEKNRFYNPIKQNKTHMKWLGQYLGENIPLFSIIVFSNRCELKKVAVESTDIRVIKRDLLYAAVRDIWENVSDALNEEKVNEVYRKLEVLIHVDQAMKEAHIENINKKFKPAERPQIFKNEVQAVPKDSSLICPSCGGTLKLRVAKKGNNAGNSFYGCSNYPKCRYVKDIE